MLQFDDNFKKNIKTLRINYRTISMGDNYFLPDKSEESENQSFRHHFSKHLDI